jgi:hypothetical protein
VEDCDGIFDWISATRGATPILISMAWHDLAYIYLLVHTIIDLSVQQSVFQCSFTLSQVWQIFEYLRLYRLLEVR